MRKRRHRRPKTEIIKINISSSFIPRTKCVVCGEEPSIYYFNDNTFLFTDPNGVKNIFDFIKRWMKRFGSDWYLYAEPRYFTGMGSFTHQVSYKGYNPKLHHSNTGTHGNLVEFISCWGGCTTWAFNQKSVKGRPEITNRKGKYTYPHKFGY